MGYTTDLAVGVWTGQTSQSGSAETELPQLDGIEGAGPIWQQMMELMHEDPRWSGLLTGPDGTPIADEFPVPAGLERREVCSATGHQATGNFDTHEEWLVRDSGPALACDSLSAYELKEVELALKDVREHGGKYARNGVASVYRYASAVGEYSGSVPDFDEESEPQQIDEADFSDDDEEIPIEPTDNG
jgi:membrane peptidoglycan carboxypeptidase